MAEAAGPPSLLERHPGRLVLGFAALQLVAWTLVPALSFPNLPLDVVEGLAWGHEWQLGYAKHPPLQAWLLEATAWLCGARDWPFYLLSQFAVVAAFAAVWTLARELTGRTGAALAVLALAGVYYFSVPTPEFNPNLVQLPLWAWSGVAFYRALTRSSLGYWLALGALAALALYAKYFAALLLLTLALFLLLEPGARQALRRPGPYLALAVAALLLLPHLRWLVAHDGLPFGYAAGRAERGGALGHLIYPARFALAQLADHAGLIGLLLLGRSGLRREATAAAALAVRTPDDAFSRRFVLALALGPLALALAFSALSGLQLRSMWGAPMFCFSGLLAVVVLRPALARRRLRLLALGWGLVFLGGLAFVGLGKPLAPYLTGTPARVHYPGPATAAFFARQWQARFGRPLAIVVGDAWHAGTIAVYAASRPSVFIAGEPRRSPWIDLQRLAESGALIVWPAGAADDGPPAALVRHLPSYEVQPVASFPWRTGADLPPLRLGWAVVPPAGP